MITQEQAIFLAEEKAQADFPAYQPGPLLSAEIEEHCWSIRLRLYHYQQRSPLDVLYGVYFSNRSWIVLLLDEAPGRTMSDEEQAMKCAAEHLTHDCPAISILDVSLAGRDNDRWTVLVFFCRRLDDPMAEASYEVWREEAVFKTRRIAIDEISKGIARRPSGTLHHQAPGNRRAP